METIRLHLKKLNTTFNYENPSDFCVSQWQKDKKCKLYVTYRWLVAFFYVFSVTTSIIYTILRNQVLVYFIYLTNWNLNFTMIMTLMSAWFATMYYKDKLDLKQEMPRKFKVMWFLSTTTTMFSIAVTLIYWNLLFKPGKSLVDLNNILIHGTNSIVLVIDLFIVKQPARFGLFLYSFICGILYLFFTWFYPALGGVNKYNENFIYSILNWNEKPMKCLIVGVLISVAGAIIHSIITIIHLLRKRLHKYISESLGKLTKEDIFFLTV